MYKPQTNEDIIARIKEIVLDPKLSNHQKLGEIAWIIRNEAKRD